MDGDTVLLDLAGSKYMTVNAAGTVLLGLLRTDCTAIELETALVDKYGIPREVAAADVGDFTRALAEKKLLAAD